MDGHTHGQRRSLISLLLFFSRHSWFWKNKSKFISHHHVACVRVCLRVNFWRPERIFMKLGVYTMAPDLIWGAYFIIRPISLSVLHMYPSYRCRSQWPLGLRLELSSLAGTLGSCVRIPLEALMYVCVFSVFMLGSGLATAWSLVQGVLPNVLD
jgi:hypothetical protein